MRGTDHFITASLVVAIWITPGAGLASGQTTAGGTPPPATVTYTGNSGFLIQAGGRKILVDALFDGFPGGYTVPASVREPMLAGRAPYDDVDLILVTHRHGDHFSATMARSALAADPRAVLVGPAEAVSGVADAGARARALDPAEGRRAGVEVNGIRVEAMRLSHGTPPAGQNGIVNLGYLITVGGVKFLHTGDIDVNSIPLSYLQALGLPDERLDVAFVPHFLLSTPVPIPFVENGLRPRYVVASHLQYTPPLDEGQIRRNYPNAVLLLTEGASWTVPLAPG